MDVNLVQKLLDMQVIKPGTEMDALYRTNDLSGTYRAMVPGNFMIVSTRQVNGEVFLEGASTEAGKRVWVRSADVIRLDGMEADRMARIYHLDVNGRPLTERRRTRRPKGAGS